MILTCYICKSEFPATRTRFPSYCGGTCRKRAFDRKLFADTPTTKTYGMVCDPNLVIGTKFPKPEPITYWGVDRNFGNAEWKTPKYIKQLRKSLNEP